MPVYEYECLKCGGRFEEIRKFSDKPLIKHDGCGGKVKKLLSAPSFHFKGTGWYVTDYANKGKDNGSKKSDADAAKAEAKGDGKTEAKKETKTEAKTDTKTEAKTESKSKDTKTKN